MNKIQQFLIIILMYIFLNSCSSTRKDIYTNYPQFEGSVTYKQCSGYGLMLTCSWRQ